jgi:hypothetical protein
MRAFEFALKAVALIAFIFVGCVALSVALAWLEDWFRK